MPRKKRRVFTIWAQIEESRPGGGDPKNADEPCPLGPAFTSFEDAADFLNWCDSQHETWRQTKEYRT